MPDSVDVPVTHGPPHGLGDRVADGRRVAGEELTRALERIRPRLHVFGHIHEDYGVAVADGRMSVNASTCDLSFRPAHAAVVLDADPQEVRVVAGGRGGERAG